jgi:hypothetical protein
MNNTIVSLTAPKLFSLFTRLTQKINEVTVAEIPVLNAAMEAVAKELDSRELHEGEELTVEVLSLLVQFQEFSSEFLFNRVFKGIVHEETQRFTRLAALAAKELFEDHDIVADEAIEAFTS